MSMRKLKLAWACLICAFLAPAALAAGPTGQEARGEYLARAANCAGCHSAPGDADFAGGLRLESRFGSFYTPNITPDRDTGIGGWSQEQFWAALHEGRRADGAPLYPACPYPNFTRVRRDDVDAIYAYLRSLPAVRRANREHELAFPYSQRSLLPAWQMLFFQPAVFEADADRDEQWNRGAYLVEGLGHCSACHAERNSLGATRSADTAAGSRVHHWYAPSLRSSAQAGLQGWQVEDAARLLRHGKSGDATTMGPMADVVFDSLQHLTEADALAVATYLVSLPDLAEEAAERRVRMSAAKREAAMAAGGEVYRRDCADCHGDDGEGSLAAPALAGNRAVTLANPTNVLNVIRDGGYPPSTAGNPRPFGMPPFHDLNPAELAAVASYIRGSWGNTAAPVYGLR